MIYRNAYVLLHDVLSTTILHQVVCRNLHGAPEHRKIRK
jgi:hypothetical protein